MQLRFVDFLCKGMPGQPRPLFDRFLSCSPESNDGATQFTSGAGAMFFTTGADTSAPKLKGGYCGAAQRSLTPTKYGQATNGRRHPEHSLAWRNPLRTLVFFQIRMISCLSDLAVLPTCSLLHDSRLLGLTLRPSASVFCCHQDSLTRGRLAFEQEAVRVSSSHSLRLVLHVVACTG